MNRDANNDPLPRSETSPTTPGAYSALAIALFAWDQVAWAASVFFSTLRAKLILSLLGCKYGRHLQVDGKLVIRAPRKGSITLGDNVRVNSRFMANLVGLTNLTIFHCSKDGRISLGDNSGCSAAIFSSKTSIRVGRNVNIGGNVRIYDHDYHPLDYRERRGETGNASKGRSQPVVIGDDVFIGANSIILKGVTIGDRSVIGAGSVVTLKEVPPNSLVAGNPARVIRSLGQSVPPSGQATNGNLHS